MDEGSKADAQANIAKLLCEAQINLVAKNTEIEQLKARLRATEEELAASKRLLTETKEANKSDAATFQPKSILKKRIEKKARAPLLSDEEPVFEPG